MTKRIMISEFPIFVVWNGLKYQNGDSQNLMKNSISNAKIHRSVIPRSLIIRQQIILPNGKIPWFKRIELNWINESRCHPMKQTYHMIGENLQRVQGLFSVVQWHENISQWLKIAFRWKAQLINYFKKCNTESEQQTGYYNLIIKCETSLRQDKLEKLCYNSEDSWWAD